MVWIFTSCRYCVVGVEMGMITVRYDDDLNFTLVHQWCAENCRGHFYPGRDWYNWTPFQENRIIQFENEKDATMFILTWS